MADYGKTVMKQFEKLRKEYGYGASGDRQAELFFRERAPSLSGDQHIELVEGFATLKGSKKKLQFVRTEPHHWTWISDDNGWLSPEGRFYPCKYGGHSHLASWLRREDYNPEETLEEEGWVKVQHRNDNDEYWFLTGAELHFDDIEKTKVTEKQIRLVSERCMELNIGKPYWCQSREDD